MPNPFGNFNSIKVQLNVKCFNPRTHVGCDKNTEGCILVGEFQSTHPRRVRQYQLVWRFQLPSFNPRTHVGCDLASRFLICAPMSFNPRTHVGCDLYSLIANCTKSEFQSTHPRRVRLWCHLLVYQFGCVSIHAPT